MVILPSVLGVPEITANQPAPFHFGWLLLASVLVVLMQAGFALLETGLGRAKNAAHTMSMNCLAYGLGITAFFICGFALMCGGSSDPRLSAGVHYFAPLTMLDHITGITFHGGTWGMFGRRGFFLAGGGIPAEAAWFMFMAVCIAVASSIPTGTLIERWRFKSFFVITLLMAGIVAPIYGCWIWGGGWLAALGTNAHLGHGGVDYAGSSAIHMVGGLAALAMVLQLGPRIGKYEMDGTPRPIFGHHAPMSILGALILAFGWFGLTLGASFAADDGRAAVVAVNTILASGAAATAAALYMWNVYGKPDPSVMCNGMLAGLVSVSASCGFVQPWAAFLIGAIGGVLAVWSVLLCERRGLDDPVGAVSVHGLGGLWGMIAVGLFADGTNGGGYNGVAGHVTGLFYGSGGLSQLLAQFIAAITCAAWSFGAATAIFFVVGNLLGGNRAAPEVELAGLDIPDLGAGGYPEFISHIAPENVPPGEVAAARAEQLE